MADVIAGSLVYQFKADIANLKAGLSEAQAQIRQMAEQARQSAGDMQRGMEGVNQEVQRLSATGRIAARALAGIFTGIATGAFLREINDAVEALRKAEEAARALGVQTRALKDLGKSASILGIDPKQLDSELVGLASKLREAQVAGGGVGDTLKKMGVAIKDASGNARPFRDVLADIADKIRNADNELDKLNALKLLGLSEELARLFERGQQALEQFNSSAVRSTDEATNAIIKKWEDITKAANLFWDGFRDTSISIIHGFVSAIESALQKLAEVFNWALEQWRKLSGEVSQSNAAAGGEQQQGGTPKRGPLTVSAELKRPKISLSGIYDKDDKDSGAAKTDPIDSYINQLKQAAAIAQAEAENWNKGNVERAKAVALAHADAIAKKEGKELTDGQRQAVVEAAGATAQYKDRVEELRQKQQDLNAAMREFADTVTNSLSDLIVRGKSAKEVLADLARTLANSALRGGLTGEGMFGQALGLGGRNGSVGGLFGMAAGALGLGGSGNGMPTMAQGGYGPDMPGFGGIFSGIGDLFAGLFADGGDIPRGKWGIVGEKGPELISGPATVTPFGKAPAAAGAEGAAPTIIHFNVTTPDAPSFARSETQMSALLTRAFARGQRNL